MLNLTIEKYFQKYKLYKNKCLDLETELKKSKFVTKKVEFQNK